VNGGRFGAPRAHALAGRGRGTGTMQSSLGWKSLFGAFVAILSWVLSPSVLDTMPPKYAGLLGAAGAMLAAFGYRSAIAKNGKGV
jgi:hypothetical protein